MAIVRMKRLRLVGLQSDRERLLRLLQKLGCVELREPELDLDDPQWAALTKPEGSGLSLAKEQNQTLNAALSVLAKYAPAKDGMLAPRPSISQSELFDERAYAAGLETAGQILDEEKALASALAEKGRLESHRAALEPWLPLNVPLEQEGDANVSILFGAVPAKTDLAALEGAVGQATELAQIFTAGSDKDLRYFLLVAHKSAERDCLEAMRAFGFSRVNLRGWTGTAADNIRRLDNRLAALEREAQQCREHIASFSGQRDALRRCIDRSAQEVSREEGKARLIDTGTAFYLEGWLPQEDLSRLEDALVDFVCAYEMEDPAEEDYPQVPVKLKNNWFTSPLNMVTNMYVLPAYDGLDPNPFMAPFFILFFGMMMADMAYGLVMLAGGWFLLKKVRAKGTMRDMGGLMVLCGVTTFLFGAVTGGFLGDFIPQLLRIINPASTFKLPALFTPLDNTIEILIGSLVLGIIQIITGMAISVVKKILDGNFIDALFDEITWWIILTGAVLAIFGIGSVSGVPVVLIVGVLMLAVGGTRKAKGLGKVGSFIGLVYNGITGYFSDILSYARLMALMLAGAVIAQVFNTLGSVTNNVVFFIIISLVGNTLNLALNLLGCYVHDLRLQCLEFFNRFYKEGGKPFSPLVVDTKYVDMIKEEN